MNFSPRQKELIEWLNTRPEKSISVILYKRERPLGVTTAIVSWLRSQAKNVHYVCQTKRQAKKFIDLVLACDPHLVTPLQQDAEHVEFMVGNNVRHSWRFAPRNSDSLRGCGEGVDTIVVDDIITLEHVVTAEPMLLVDARIILVVNLKRDGDLDTAKLTEETLKKRYGELISEDSLYRL